MNNSIIVLTELPQGWVWTTVGDIYDIVGGGTPSTAVAEYWEGDIPWITSADILGLRDIRPRRQITRQAIENSATNLVPAGSLIVVTRVGLGKIALTKIPICFSQDSQALVCGTTSLSPDYLLYCLSQAVQLFKYKHRGTTINGVTKKQLAELPFVVPPLAEQHRIVDKIEELFTKLDAGVEALRMIKAQLKRYRQSVIKHAFEGKLTQEWRQAHKDELEPASVLLERIKQERHKTAKGKYKELPPLDTSDLPKLPEGWMWTRVGDTCGTTSGGTPSRRKMTYYGGNIPWLKSGEFKDNVIKSAEEFITEEGLKNSSTQIIPKGSLLMALYGATVGKLGILAIDAAINQAICAIFTPIQLNKKLLFWYLIKYRYELLAARRGGAQPNISQGIVNNIRLPLSPLPEQKEIVSEIERRFSMADEIEKTVEHSLKQAERLRNSILKRACEGKLVPQDPNDEPAEKLLEHIKEERAKQQGAAKSAKSPKTKGSTKQMRLV